MKNMPIPKGMVCRASKTVNGVIYYAKDYGKKAFCWFPKQENNKKTTFFEKVVSL